MQKTYNRINWKNYPSEDTALDEENLNKMDAALDEVDNKIINLDTTKSTKVEVSTLISDVAFDKSTGVIKFTRKNGGTVTFDTKLEKLAVNFSYDPTTEQLIITLDDGTKQYVDLSALITQYEFLGSDTIAFSIQDDGKVKATVLEGSIQEKHLRPDYLADIKVQAANAQASAETAQAKATSAAKSEANAQESAESAWAAAAITVPEFYIDFETGCLMSKTEAKGIEFEIVDGYFYGKVVA